MTHGGDCVKLFEDKTQIISLAAEQILNEEVVDKVEKETALMHKLLKHLYEQIEIIFRQVNNQFRIRFCENVDKVNPDCLNKLIFMSN